MKPTIYISNKKQVASFRIAGLMLAIAPLWLMLAAAGAGLAGVAVVSTGSSAGAAISGR